MKIIVVSDHAGFDLKEELKKYIITQLGYSVDDQGVFTNKKPADDYAYLAARAASKISAGKYDRGIFICGTGIGMIIAANKIPGIRAAVCNDLFCAQKSRQHNNANVCGLGARIIGIKMAKKIVKIWLTTEFEGGRHTARIQKYSDIERIFCKNSVIEKDIISNLDSNL